MKLIYIANARLPTEKAHGIQIMKTCQSFVRLGADVELWLPKRRNEKFAGRDLFDVYGVVERFPVAYFKTFDLVGRLPRLGFYIQSKTFAASVKKALPRVPADAVFYSRDAIPLEAVRAAGRIYFYEAHTIAPHPRSAVRRVWEGAAGIIAISQNLSDEYKKYVPAAKLAVAHDGVDLNAFTPGLNQRQARKQLGFPQEAKLVGYAGHLYGWKGTEVLALASAYLEGNARVFFVGGTAEDVAHFRVFCRMRKLDRVDILGHVPPQQVPLYLAAADALVLPNSARYAISSHTSPLKLFEYMAAHRPIAASDLPSIREIVDETTALFFPPDDPLALARAVNQLLADPGLAERLAANAAARVRQYTWEQRGKRILQFMRSRL